MPDIVRNFTIYIVVMVTIKLHEMEYTSKMNHAPIRIWNINSASQSWVKNPEI
jgi:hypothetical protein